MKHRSIGFAAVVLGAITCLVSPAIADWNPGDPYKMHFPQLPDPNGWDVNVTLGPFVADDWLCTQTGPVADMHVWFSSRHDSFSPDRLPAGIMVRIYSDKPSSTSNPYSMPDELLWERGFFASGYTAREYGTGDRGWLYPGAEYFEHDHEKIWQFNFENIPNAFIQEEGSIYWLAINLPPVVPSDPRLGWSTSLDHWNDNAVWWDDPQTSWGELRDPITDESLDLAFVITPVPEPCTFVIWSLLGILGISVGWWRRRR